MTSNNNKRYDWIVTDNEDYEGGYVIGVYDSREKAMFNASLRANKISHDREVIITDSDDTIYYKWGCDYIQVEKFEVE